VVIDDLKTALLAEAVERVNQALARDSELGLDRRARVRGYRYEQRRSQT
jgi:hypothetical protein